VLRTFLFLSAHFRRTNVLHRLHWVLHYILPEPLHWLHVVKSSRMNYQFLLGEKFVVKGEIFTVEEVSKLNDRNIVHATSEVTEPVNRRAFPIELVLKTLITEEIELFQAGGLTA